MKISQENLKNFIDSEAWTKFGIISIDEVKTALQHHEGIFEKWVQAGYQAEMEYLKKMQNDRFHPENKLPDVKSVVVLMAWYGSDGYRMDLEWSSDGSRIDANRLQSELIRDDSSQSATIRKQSESNPKTIRKQTGIVAQYARGRDYHQILKKKLINLSKWLKDQGEGIETYLSVDSGPTVDRVLAQTAGLGFFGKNANLIDPRKGSYFFIASLMTNVELEPTKKDHMPSCGTCQKCIVACPTKAIVAPGVIDARRCISYLTIENKKGIPVELRSQIGDRLFGCDICQEVCPFNIGRAGKQEIRMEELKSEHGAGEHLDLKEILSLQTDEEFLQKFAGTPLMRAKRRGLIRNACIVAGNSGDKALIPFLQGVIEQEEDEMLKEHAKWGIEQINKVFSKALDR